MNLVSERERVLSARLAEPEVHKLFLLALIESFAILSELMFAQAASFLFWLHSTTMGTAFNWGWKRRLETRYRRRPQVRWSQNISFQLKLEKLISEFDLITDIISHNSVSDSSPSSIIICCWKLNGSLKRTLRICDGDFNDLSLGCSSSTRHGDISS